MERRSPQWLTYMKQWIEQKRQLLQASITWTSVAKATGVYDKSYNIRERSKGKEKESSIRHDVAIENDDEEGDEEDYEVGDNVEEDNEAFLTFADDDDSQEE
ncbi:uncharacterized protein LOC114578793 [Dendrobium catenatum]|uniref:uncharacterized protein LOC114578793 n=1 Tax=Dendrobium catenatum TaxID=906689 RepID=UPI00109F0EDA|nr:uncharacterized protein LOC114578793 [Dendrobium catenatum]